MLHTRSPVTGVELVWICLKYVMVFHNAKMERMKHLAIVRINKTILNNLFLLYYTIIVPNSVYFLVSLLDMTCDPDNLMCSTGLCVPHEMICNDFWDCPFGEDEFNCTGKKDNNA